MRPPDAGARGRCSSAPAPALLKNARLKHEPNVVAVARFGAQLRVAASRYSSMPRFSSPGALKRVMRPVLNATWQRYQSVTACARIGVGGQVLDVFGALNSLLP